VDFTGNTAELGGGLWSSATSLALDTSTWIGNTATVGGGLYLTGGAVAEGTDLSLTDNAAVTDGGGLWSDSTVTLHTSTFARNAAGGAGGALAQTGVTLVVEDSEFLDNEAGTSGSAIAGFGTDLDLHGSDVQAGTTTPYLWLHDALADLDRSVLTGPSPYSVATAVWMTGTNPHSTLSAALAEVHDFTVYADGEGEDHTVIGALMTFDQVDLTVGFGSISFVTVDGTFTCVSGACAD
jgi:hypothetical protein